MNVDGFIARQNIQRAQMGYELDWQYLATLSSDAVPVMISEFNSAKLTQDIKDILGSDLACRVSLAQDSKHLPWQSFHFGNARSQELLSTLDNELAKYSVTQTNGYSTVHVGSLEYPCNFINGMD
jgi:hypothetical protein